MTTIKLDIIFIRPNIFDRVLPVATIHAATAVGHGYGALCGLMYAHDTPEYRFTKDGNFSDVCADCAEHMESLGLPTTGRVYNALGEIASEPSLLRAVQHLYEAARHITGYGMQCPVCGGTRVDGDEGCRMCLPLGSIADEGEKLTGLATAILLIEDPFESVP